MKRYIFVAIFSLFNLIICSAQEINFEPSIETAFAKAQKANKLVFVEYYNEKCHVCQSIEPFFKDKGMSEFYNENFINYRLNTYEMKKVDSLFLKQTKLEFDGFPFFLFFDKNKNFIHYSGAKPDANYLINIGKTALNPDERTGSLPEKYKNGDRSIKTLYAYSSLVQLYKNQKLVNTIADELFKGFPENQLDTRKSYLVLKNDVFDIDNGFFVFWANHLNKMINFEQNAKSGTEKEVIQKILLNAINSDDRKNWGLEKINRAKEMVLKTELSTNPNTYFWEQESTLLVKNNKTKDAMAIFEQMMAKNDNITTKCYTIEHFLSIFETKTDLDVVNNQTTILLKEKASPQEKSNLLYENALYLYKIKDKKTAKKQAESLMTFEKKNGLDSKKTSELIKQN